MRLQQILDIGAAAPLQSELLRARGSPIEIDASGVERLGGLCLQVLLAAKAAWRADNQAFHIVNPSPSFVEAARLMGAADLSEPGGAP
jgi:chemotaxis protein CheX